MSCIIPPQHFLPPGGDIPTGLLGQVERRAECRGCAREPLPFCSKKPEPLQRREGKKEKSNPLAGWLCLFGGRSADSRQTGLVLVLPGARVCSCKGRAAHGPREMPWRQGDASGEGPRLAPLHKWVGRMGGNNQLEEHVLLSVVRSQNASVVSSPSTSALEHPTGALGQEGSRDVAPKSTKAMKTS